MERITDQRRQNLIGENLRQTRIDKGLSQQQLADKLETLAAYVCRGSISRIETGERTVTDIEVDGFSRVLGVTLQELFYGSTK